MSLFRGMQDALLTPWQARHLLAQCIVSAWHLAGGGALRLSGSHIRLARVLAWVADTPRGVPVVAIAGLVAERLTGLSSTDLQTLADEAERRRADRTTPLATRRLWAEVLGSVEGARRSTTDIPLPFRRAFEMQPMSKVSGP